MKYCEVKPEDGWNSISVHYMYKYAAKIQNKLETDLQHQCIKNDNNDRCESSLKHVVTKKKRKRDTWAGFKPGLPAPNEKKKITGWDRNSQGPLATNEQTDNSCLLTPLHFVNGAHSGYSE